MRLGRFSTLVITAPLCAAGLTACGGHKYGQAEPQLVSRSPQSAQPHALTHAERRQAQTLVRHSPLLGRMSAGTKVSVGHVTTLTGFLTKKPLTAAIVVVSFSHPTAVPLGQRILSHKAEGQINGPVPLKGAFVRNHSAAAGATTYWFMVNLATSRLLGVDPRPTVP